MHVFWVAFTLLVIPINKFDYNNDILLVSLKKIRIYIWSNAIYPEGYYSEEFPIEIPTNESSCWPQNMGGGGGGVRFLF